jgi:metal-responsive CopG/Arc/MetJ family transcriptional regulator
MWTYDKEIHLRLPADLLEAVNAAAMASFACRSDYIREAVVMRLQKEDRLVDRTAEERQEAQSREEELLKRYGLI